MGNGDGRWAMGNGRWAIVNGQRSMVNGQWGWAMAMGMGRWAMGDGGNGRWRWASRSRGRWAKLRSMGDGQAVGAVDLGMGRGAELTPTVSCGWRLRRNSSGDRCRAGGGEAGCCAALRASRAGSETSMRVATVWARSAPKAAMASSPACRRGAGSGGADEDAEPDGRYGRGETEGAVDTRRKSEARRLAIGGVFGLGHEGHSASWRTATSSVRHGLLSCGKTARARYGASQWR